MVAKTVERIVDKTIVESKLLTYTPLDGEVLIVKKTDGTLYVRVGDGVTAGGKPPLMEAATQLPSVPWSKLTSIPTTLAGYGITDAPTTAAMTAAIENAIGGLSWKDAVRAATTANITLSAAQTIDGVAVIAGDRVLVKNQTTASANGIYVVAAGAWMRAVDMDIASEFANSLVVPVADGTVNADSMWQMTTNGAVTVGTTALTFQAFNITPYTGGTGITVSGGQISLNTAFIATTAAAGLMSAADKTKLDGITAGANAYTHPATHPASIITQDSANRFVTDTEKTAWNAKEAAFDSIVASPIV